MTIVVFSIARLYTYLPTLCSNQNKLTNGHIRFFYRHLQTMSYTPIGWEKHVDH